MKKKKYLPLYYEWMESGEIPRSGLCNSLNDTDDPFHKDELLIQFAPLFEEEPARYLCAQYWGHGNEDGDIHTSEIAYQFSTLRQTLILFCAVLNGELKNKKR